MVINIDDRNNIIIEKRILTRERGGYYYASTRVEYKCRQQTKGKVTY
jgi:hypothetical protein